jgi:hypothetical protein
MPVTPSYREDDIGRITIPGQLGKKGSQDLLSMKKAGQIGAHLSSSYSGKLKIGGLQSRPSLSKSETISPKITIAKRAGGKSQVYSTCLTSATPGTTKINK